jgi:rRNA processing protein Gar1
MDDINIKGPKTTYNNEEVISGIRKYILEHIIWINGILANLERAECTILKAKSQFCMSRFRVIGFICDILGRYPNTFKVIKIVKWLFPNNIVEAKTFIRVTVYYKIFIKNFAVIAALIYFLIRKKIKFAWDTE